MRRIGLGQNLTNSAAFALVPIVVMLLGACGQATEKTRTAADDVDAIRTTAQAEAQVFMQSGKFDKAILVYDRALQKAPNDPTLLRERSKYYYFYSFVYGTEQGIPSKQTFLARAQAKREKLNHAVSDITSAITGSPNDVASYIQRAECYAGLKDFKAALNDLEKALQLDAGADVYNCRSNIYMAQKRYEEALADQTKEVELASKGDKSSLMVAHIGRANGLTALGRLDEALDEYLQANAAGKVPPVIVAQNLTQRADIFLKQKQYQKALVEVKKALAIKDAPANSYLVLGSSYAGLGKTSEALGAFSKALELAPEFAEAYSARAEIYSKLGNKIAAKKDLESARELLANRES